MSNYTPQQKMAMVMRQLAYVKAELHTAVNPMSLRDRVRDFVDTMEFAIGGYISDGNPNQIPGTPAALLDDPTKTKVEFTSGPGAVMQAREKAEAQQRATGFSPHLPAFPSAGVSPAAPVRAPGTPIVNGDVQFVPGPPPGTSTGIGNGQSVEFIRADGVRVDGNGVPIGQQAAPAGPFAESQPASIGGTHMTPPLIPGAPASNEAAGRIIGHQPSRTTEAGGNVLPSAGLFPGVAEAPRAEAQSASESVLPFGGE